MPEKQSRFFCSFFVSLLAAMLFCQTAIDPQYVSAQNAAESPLKESELYARAAVLMDAGNGRVLFGKNADSPMPMASTTKIMTCILTLETADLTDLVTVSAYAAKMPDVQLNMREGEHYLLEDLLYSLMLESHNDSAVAIAEHVGGSVEAFAEMMNRKAEEIGCVNTHFITPNGLDATETVQTEDGAQKTVAHSTTAADLARIMSYCIMRSPEKEQFLSITRAASHSFQNKEQAKDGGIVNGARSFTCNNHNAFLHMMDGALTGKTGFTGNAGYCYVGALESAGRTYAVALLACGWPHNKTWKWKDAAKLFTYGEENYELKDITDYDLELPAMTVRNAAGEDARLGQEIQAQPVVAQEKQEMLLSESDRVEIKTKLADTLTAPLAAGTKIGSVAYYVNGEQVSAYPVTIGADIGARDFGWYMALVLKRFFSMLENFHFS